MELVRIQLCELFNKEWKHIVDSYNSMHEQVQYYERLALAA